MNWYLVALYKESRTPQTAVYSMQAHSAADAWFLTQKLLDKCTPRQEVIEQIICANQSDAMAWPTLPGLAHVKTHLGESR